MAITILLLIGSNCFMTVAWYWHLKVAVMPLWTVILISWLIALPEYCLAMPANRIGHISQGGPFTAPQLKILQEGIAIAAFVIFSLLVLKEIPTWRDGAALALILAGLGVALWR
jgi:uncharacterized protein (DUF486 family)